ncbi:hypothetical protein PR048_030814 [Dryococelus australis]|uniref:Uncharacterized protein n=1 Tax=Dryococelus australis TaxID=614101 RepID=A0ABQ9G9Y1_9NEOP|nr:hypothetical protein PR048_030814 [Dryococelus australis]
MQDSEPTVYAQHSGSFLPCGRVKQENEPCLWRPTTYNSLLQYELCSDATLRAVHVQRPQGVAAEGKYLLALERRFLTPINLASQTPNYSSALTQTSQGKIDCKRVYTGVTSAIGSEFIMHALDDSQPIADLKGNKKRVPCCQACGDTGAAANEQTSEARLYKRFVVPSLRVIEPAKFSYPFLWVPPTWCLICLRKAAVAERLACSPPTKANRVQSNPLPGHSQIFASGNRAAGRRVFSGISLPLPRYYVLAMLHTHLTSPSSVLKTSLLRAAQISSLTQGCTALASHILELSSIPGRVAPGFSHVGIVPDDTAVRWGFSGISPPPPHLPHRPHSGATPYPPRLTLIGSQDLDIKIPPNLFTHIFDVADCILCIMKVHDTINKLEKLVVQYRRRILTFIFGCSFTPGAGLLQATVHGGWARGSANWSRKGCAPRVACHVSRSRLYDAEGRDLREDDGHQLKSPSLGGGCLALGPPPYAFIIIYRKPLLLKPSNQCDEKERFSRGVVRAMQRTGRRRNRHPELQRGQCQYNISTPSLPPPPPLDNSFVIVIPAQPYLPHLTYFKPSQQSVTKIMPRLVSGAMSLAPRLVPAKVAQVSILHDTLAELEASLRATFETIKNTPAIINDVPSNMLRRCKACIECGGDNFEQLLYSLRVHSTVLIYTLLTLHAIIAFLGTKRHFCKWRFVADLNIEVLGADEGVARRGKWEGYLKISLPTSGIVRHDSHNARIRSDPAGD